MKIVCRQKLDEVPIAGNSPLRSRPFEPNENGEKVTPDTTPIGKYPGSLPALVGIIVPHCFEPFFLLDKLQLTDIKRNHSEMHASTWNALQIRSGLQTNSNSSRY